MKKILLATASLLALTVAASATPTIFNYTGTIVDYTIPVTGEYEITAVGGVGGTGSAPGASGGNGADVYAYFDLTAGTQLGILVGNEGDGYTSGYGGTRFGGGGGGGSFVIDQSASGSALVIAGGGGGGAGGGPGLSPNNSPAGSGGQATLSGANGGSNGSIGPGPGLGGFVDGGGGGYAGGGGGGGFNGNGQNSLTNPSNNIPLFGSGGGGYTPGGGVGGLGSPFGTFGAGGAGGFGGGGGAYYGGGGGGGASGGGGGKYNAGGGGGGSYISNTSLTGYIYSGANSPLSVAQGYVTIAVVPTDSRPPSPAPEPLSSTLLGAGIAGVAFVRRRMASKKG